MEAATLQKKKNTISKGKLKKNIKNVLCRPDQMFWPEIKEDEAKRLEIALLMHRIKISEFKKPHWEELKLIPKEKRPKSSKLKKVEGLLLGIAECCTAIQNGQCSAIIIEATVNPRMIVQPVIELCTSKDIPLLCLNNLRNLTLACFGVKTSSLGVNQGFLLELTKVILDISKLYPKTKCNHEIETEKMEVEDKQVIKSESMDINESPYLYRTNKKIRVFVPTSQEKTTMTTNKFTGQDFIKFADTVGDNKYKKMMLKRISNNPDRKIKK